MKKWLLLLPVTLLTVYSFTWTTPIASDAFTPQLPPSPYRMLYLVNQERAKVGAKPLQIDPNVQKSAQLKATDFAQRDYYDHIVKGTDDVLTPEMSDLAYKNCTYVSENINGDVMSSEQAVDKWMQSKPHKAAILDQRFSQTGFGVSQEKDGDYFAIQHFCIAN